MDVEEVRVTGSWGDSPPPENNSGDDDADVTVEKDDRVDAPVLWSKNVFGMNSSELEVCILNAFKARGVEGVEVVYTHISTHQERSHAYVLLNSLRHSNQILEGVIPVVYEGTDSDAEDNVLNFEAAEHLEPRENQHGCIVYLWQLDYGRRERDVVKYFDNLISGWTPVNEIIPQYDQQKQFKNAIKIKFFCYEDARKCIYLLNYRDVEGVVIRAGFCTIDYSTNTRYKPTSSDRANASRKKKPTKSNDNVSLRKKPIPTKESTAPVIKAAKDTWVEVKPAKKRSNNKKANK